eukprot:3378607-Amphidinium_carterae.2
MAQVLRGRDYFLAPTSLMGVNIKPWRGNPKGFRPSVYCNFGPSLWVLQRVLLLQETGGGTPLVKERVLEAVEPLLNQKQRQSKLNAESDAAKGEERGCKNHHGPPKL